MNSSIQRTAMPRKDYGQGEFNKSVVYFMKYYGLYLSKN